MAGPDLLNVTDRRDLEWLKKWMKDPPAMMETDEAAQALLKEAKGVKMPNMKLTDAQIDALIHYMASESQKRSK
jgi:protein SCO1/2